MRSAMIYNFLIEANLMASIAILLMIPLRRFFRRQVGNTAICFGWLLVAIRLLCPLSLVNPFIHEIRSPFAADTAIRPIAGQIKVRVTDALGDLSMLFFRADNQPAYEVTSRFRMEMENAQASITLAKVWLIGALLVLLWFLISNLSFRLRLRADRIAPIDGELLDQYRELCRRRGIRPVPVIFTDPLPSACLVGVFRPWIALPLSASPQDAIHVLTHEICHVKNGDHLWGLLRLLCCAIHWFNPLVWLAATMSRTDSELRCDDRVTGPMNREERKAYAGVLVLAAARRSAPGLGVLATGMTMTGKRLKARVTTVLEGRHPVRALAILFGAVAVICLMGAFSTRERDTDLWALAGDAEIVHLVPGHDVREMPEDMEAYENRLWQLAGYDPGELSSAEVTFFPDGRMMRQRVDHHCLFDVDGTLLELQDEAVPWLSETMQESVKYARDKAALQQISDRVIAFLDAVNPGMSRTIETMEVGWEEALDGQIWMMISGIPKDRENGEWITFVVRLEPEWQIQYFACISNG